VKKKKQNQKGALTLCTDAGIRADNSNNGYS